MSSTTSRSKPAKPGYFRRWYAENGEALNQSRKRRYQEDPEYKAKVLEGNRQARAARREQARLAAAPAEQAKKVLTKLPTWRGVVVGADTLMTIGALASTAGVTVQTVRSWERTGNIPEPTARTEAGVRLYSQEMLDQIYEAQRDAGKIKTEGVVHIPPARCYHFLVRWPDGSERVVPFYRVGVLATTLGRRASAIDTLERRGLLPVSPFRWSGRGHRLYTPKMLLDVYCVLHGGFDDPKAEILERWACLGLDGAQLVEPVNVTVAEDR